MNILFISECSGTAIAETRRILDSFGERIGHSTWTAQLTMEGLSTVRRLLKKTARRNTAVACHCRRASGEELLWIVGTMRKFDRNGRVATAQTATDILRRRDESQWQTIEVMAMAAGIAGLFHDFGKSTAHFQAKLKSQTRTVDPIRHEWVSLRLFEAFVRGLSDQQWLDRLQQVKADDEDTVMVQLIRDVGTDEPNAFLGLAPFAKLVAWLVVSHHKLPVFYSKNNAPLIGNIDKWLHESFNPEWNSPSVINSDTFTQQIKEFWRFPSGTPIKSATWRKKATYLAARAKKCNLDYQANWLEHRFTAHLARLSLMLADHAYSSYPEDKSRLEWRDLDYQCFANTARSSGKLKQKLDEHNVAVGWMSFKFARNLPLLRGSLPALAHIPRLARRSSNKDFAWQDKAMDLAKSCSKESLTRGFFGVVMASTGKGKTLGNMKIAYALSSTEKSCRLSYAIGLRSLTLQTGDALRNKLKLDDEDMAVMIGSKAFQTLYEIKQDESSEGEGQSLYESFGSESAIDPAGDDSISYEGTIYDGTLRTWLGPESKLLRLVSAPILVSTIDHLMPATEGYRGGKQIAPMLRLLTSDLIIDEPDDFDLADLPALTRLAHWAGMLGSKLILSSATLPPSLVVALFQGYKAGREDYARSNSGVARDGGIISAWFDEFSSESKVSNSVKDFYGHHQAFVQSRVRRLAAVQETKRIGKLVSVVVPSPRTKENVLTAIAGTIRDSVLRLHTDHCLEGVNGKKLSVGLLRMANIDPLVAVAKRLFIQAAPENFRFHFCVYHSQFPLAVRSKIEAVLDNVLGRHNPAKIWTIPEIRDPLGAYAEENHVFMVLASPVAEVGRDHDYDWIIVEPSSARSLIQIAGRLLRHRSGSALSPNMHILDYNYKALIRKIPAYCRPGFESMVYRLKNHDLMSILSNFKMNGIDATARITQPEINEIKRDMQRGSILKDLVALEHVALNVKMFGASDSPEIPGANIFWEKQVSWCAELIRRQPFRSQDAETKDMFSLMLLNENDEPTFHRKVRRGFYTEYPPAAEFKPSKSIFGERCNRWFDASPLNVYKKLADRLDSDIVSVSKRFGEIELRQLRDAESWFFDPFLGVFQEPSNVHKELPIRQ